jgi:hypothetical protein
VPDSSVVGRSCKSGHGPDQRLTYLHCSPSLPYSGKNEGALDPVLVLLT